MAWNKRYSAFHLVWIEESALAHCLSHFLHQTGVHFGGKCSICRIERIRDLSTHCSREVIYAITSLPAGKLLPASLLQLSRDHWQIENGLFHAPDVTFREGASRVRSGAAPEALADLRNAALTLMRRRKLKPRDARVAFAANKWTAIRLVMRS